MTDKKESNAKWVLLGVGVVILFAVVATFIQTKLEPKPPVEFKTIKNVDDGVTLVMDVVIDPKTTKQQAIDLGYFFKDKYLLKRKNVKIGIFNDEEIAKNRLSPQIPETELFQHYLVDVGVNSTRNYSEVKWMKK